MKINKVDSKLIGARNGDLAVKIREAQFLEDLANKGSSPEEIISEVKVTLGLEENQSVIAEFTEKTKELNLLQKNFVDVNSLTQRLIDAKLIEESEIAVLNKVESRIAEKLSGVFDLDIEDLYEAEEE